MSASGKWGRGVLLAVLALSLGIPVGCSSAQVYPYTDDGIEPCERPCPPPCRRKSPVASLGQALLYTVAVVPGVVALAALALADGLEPNPCQPVVEHGSPQPCPSAPCEP